MKKFKKAVIITAIFTLALTLTACAAYRVLSADNLLPNESSLLPDRPKIVIDAGHGGADGGVSGAKTNVKESELNLKISFKLKEALEDYGCEVIMTREREEPPDYKRGFKLRDMNKRKEIIKQADPDIVISIHQNKFRQPSRGGAQVVYDKHSEESRILAERIQVALNKNQDKKTIALAGEYFILKCTQNPSVIVECGFLSNEKDERNLITDEFQTKIAKIISEGIIDYYSART
jgi:N-acetylmuramoyl-L-alanine amidase